MKLLITAKIEVEVDPRDFFHKSNCKPEELIETLEDDNGYEAFILLNEEFDSSGKGTITVTEVKQPSEREDENH